MTDSPPCIYLRSQPFDPEELQHRMGQARRLTILAKAQSDFVAADTFDHQLWHAGQALLVSVSGYLLFQGSELVASGAFRSGLPRLVKELPGGLATRIKSDPVRALLPGNTIEVSEWKINLADRQGKAVVRLLNLRSNDRRFGWLCIKPPKGCLKPFSRLRSALESLGLEPLKPGSRKLLKLLGGRAGAYQSKPNIRIDQEEPAQQLARRICHTMIAVARQNEAGIHRDLDTEFLHDYRVSLRKVRSVISLFRKVFPVDATDKLKRDLASLMKRSNRLRDLDVYLLDREHYFEMLPGYLHPGLDKMFQDFARERRREQGKVCDWLSSKEYHREVERLQRFFDASAPLAAPNANAPAGILARQAIWKRYCKACEVARTICADTPNQRVHQLRVQCKKLRYLMEFFAPLFSKKAMKKLIKALKGLQDNLGRFNDFSVQQESLRDYLQGKVDRDELDLEVADVIGALRLVLHNKQREERAQVMSSFKRFHSPELHLIFQDCFQRRAPGGEKRKKISV